MSEDRDQLHTNTVYVFIDKQVIQPTHNRHGWLKCIRCGFTLDSTGDNLPTIARWKFKNEIQPDQTLVFPLYPITEPGYGRLRRGLLDKGWYVGDIITGWAYDQKDIKLEVEPEFTDAAAELLAQLLKEPKR